MKAPNPKTGEDMHDMNAIGMVWHQMERWEARVRERAKHSTRKLALVLDKDGKAEDVNVGTRGVRLDQDTSSLFGA
jgi:hypothetical protein